jgi:hypothetical protein
MVYSDCACEGLSFLQKLEFKLNFLFIFLPYFSNSGYVREFFDLYYITSRSGESKRAEAGGALLGCGKKLERGRYKGKSKLRIGEMYLHCTALHYME